MPLRDDHDAALARADALSDELERERAKQAEQTEHVARLEAELTAARTRLGRAEEVLGKLKPTPEPVVASVVAPRAGEPQPKVSVRAAMMVGGIVVVVAVLAIMLARVDRDQHRSDSDEPRGPVPPFVADTLVAQGLAEVTGDLFVREVHVDYVRDDGMLDETHGTIRVETGKLPPPRPPDDPTRPTGAPNHDDLSMTHMMIGSCRQPRWGPRTGWQNDMGSCMSFGARPTGTPTCKISAILALAKADGAPASALARISASPDGGAGWRWTYDVNDSARGVGFSRSYRDAACAAPPAER